ncbi:TRAP transporter small permease subunit [Pollutimonas thiosulfatoxidans]|uniref:TRAP transporter small permease protein n=1 Tax=Pollutimonas thiosulfatoxidans TaxID=2028345 RepID=A0A410GG36_9BURK|nr:TRAP transporter small permease [Pollutimonas thiosulfatoxidans]MBF6616772.1 TRAP transporter small permease [Candidimonas sp.]QAA95254.1 C4-dicarboxylate ABC transporter permease [Pollutimonas thiosulfatoxidans]
MNITTERYVLLDRLLRAANSFSRVAIWVAGSLTLASALYITADVITRKFFSIALGGSDELSGYAFAISISWALAFATLQRANIRIDALYQLLPVRLCALLDWIALVGLSVFIIYLTRYAADVALLSWDRNATANTVMATPLWIPQSLWVIGLVWLCLVLALMLIRSSIALITGDLVTVRAISGIRSSKEEADEEADAGRRMVRGDFQ